GDDKIGLEIDELLGHRLRSDWLAGIRTIVDMKVAAFAPSQLLESLLQHRAALHVLGIILGQRHQDADAPQAFALRAHRQRPSCRRAAEQRDELAPIRLIEMHPIPYRLGPRTNRIYNSRTSQEVSRRRWPYPELGTPRRQSDRYHR